MMNLISTFENNNWKIRYPRVNISPKFQKRQMNDVVQLMITSNGNLNNFGKWICHVNGIQERESYEFSVEYYTENIKCENESIFEILTWMDTDGNIIQRDYVDDVLKLKDGWKYFHKVIEAPSQSCGIKVELGLRWSENGIVYWRNPVVIKAKAKLHRIVKVATTYIEPRKDFKANMEAMTNIVETAGKMGVDIVCLTETFYDFLIDLPLVQKCMAIPCKLTEAISDKATKYGTYVIFTMYEKDGEDIYNTAVLIGRKGELIGKYRKIHLPLYEGESGVTPGNEYGIFETDFGKIGIMICWDQVFPEVAKTLSLKGAELIFLPTMGNELLQQRARAKDNGIHVIVSGIDCPESSRIINPLGDIIGTSKEGIEGVYLTEIDLDKKYYTYWISVGPCNGEPRSVYKRETRL